MRILNTQIASLLGTATHSLPRARRRRGEKFWLKRKKGSTDEYIFKERRPCIYELYYLRLPFWFLLTAPMCAAVGRKLHLALKSCMYMELYDFLCVRGKKKLQVRTLRRSLRLDGFDAGM